MSSLQKILDLQPQVIYPGHGIVIQNPIQLVQGKFDVILDIPILFLIKEVIFLMLIKLINYMCTLASL